MPQSAPPSSSSSSLTPSPSASSTSTLPIPSRTIKLRLIAWDLTSKTEICSHQNAPTLDLTLKLKKKWSEVLAYLAKKWGDVDNLQNRLQIFLFQAGVDTEGMDCLSDINMSVGQSLRNHPTLLNGVSSAIPVIELFYHLKPIVNANAESDLNNLSSFKALDPTLDAFCELVKDQEVPPLYPSSTRVPSAKRLALSSHDNSRTVKQKVESFKSDSEKFQHRSLEILNLPLLLGQSIENPVPPPVDIPHNIRNVETDDTCQDSHLLELIRDGLQAIADTPLSTLPPFDVTNDATAKAISTHRVSDLEMAPQFNSDTIAHLLEVMQDTKSGENLGNDSGNCMAPIEPPVLAIPQGSFTIPQDIIPQQKSTGSNLIPSESETELSDFKAQTTLASRTSPDETSHISHVESETIQDSDGDIARCTLSTNSLRPKHSAPNSTAASAYRSVSHFSIGIPKEIMKANRRKPHLKRINPTLIGPLVSNGESSSWA